MSHTTSLSESMPTPTLLKISGSATNSTHEFLATKMHEM